jgi:GDP-fucose transporter C1
VTALQIQVTTPLTHNISGTAKACAQTVLAVIWFQENKTILWFFSNFLVMIASAVYARVKQLEMAKTHASFSRVKEEDIEKLLSEDENTFKDSQV